MAILTLAEAKQQCRVTHSLEDLLIQDCIDAAEEWIANYINQSSVPFTPSTKSAAKLIVQHLFENRSSHVPEQMYENPALDRLLFPLRQNMGM